MSTKIKLITPVNITPQKDEVTCSSKVLTIGSCFSDNIGNRLSSHLFDTMINPFGTIFNPISIAKVLRLAMNNATISAEDLHTNGNRNFHYDFHSSFDNSNPHQVIDRINDSINSTGEYIRNVDFLVLTFGTSIVYKLKEDERIVSNCHKVSNNNFLKEFLPVSFMNQRIFEIIDLITKINPAVKIILTVSPVRHTKEGLVENSISKSRLIDLCYSLSKENTQISYFPAFEIMMDELRDYRYYKSDLIHPSNLAIDIIWSRFMESYLDVKAKQKVKDISELNSARNHRPFDPNSEEHQIFMQNQLRKTERLKEFYPEVDFLNYKQYFTS